MTFENSFRQSLLFSIVLYVLRCTMADAGVEQDAVRASINQRLEETGEKARYATGRSVHLAHSIITISSLPLISEQFFARTFALSHYHHFFPALSFSVSPTCWFQIEGASPSKAGRVWMEGRVEGLLPRSVTKHPHVWWTRAGERLPQEVELDPPPR
jgi:hypothetical protein